MDQYIINAAERDEQLAKRYGIDMHHPHAPYTLSFSNVTVCLTCSRERRENKRWWQFFKNTQVLWPCSEVRKENACNI